MKFFRSVFLIEFHFPCRPIIHITFPLGAMSLSHLFPLVSTQTPPHQLQLLLNSSLISFTSFSPHSHLYPFPKTHICVFTFVCFVLSSTILGHLCFKYITFPSLRPSLNGKRWEEARKYSCSNPSNNKFYTIIIKWIDVKINKNSLLRNNIMWINVKKINK